MESSLQIIDFQKTASNSIFVQINGYDAEREAFFTGEVKFLGGRPYGDIIHTDRTSLSEACREFVADRLIAMFQEGQFD